jgi:sigma-B regulation protein RsbU (phosphoserine phosphatase)
MQAHNSSVHYLRTANELVNLAKQVLSLVSQLDKNELANIDSQTLSDIKKVEVGAELFLKTVENFIDKEHPKLKQNDPNLSEQLSKIRHDMRTPINVIKGYSEIIVEDLENNNMVKNFSSVIELAMEILRLISKLTEKEPIQEENNGARLQDEVMLTSQEEEELHNKIEKDSIFQQLVTKAKQQLATQISSILIVDDIEANRDLLASWLGRKSYNTFVAEDGAAALAILKKYPMIDIVLLDIMMPGMDGYEVLSRIKANVQTSDIMVIMITALDEMDSIVRCIKNGAEDYIIKPFNSHLLGARISSCLEKKRLMDLEKAYILGLQEELSIAKKIQVSMLPLHFIDTEDYKIYGRSIPAKEVGGDFYDYYDLGNGKLGCCIGDISGKGIYAALFMAISRTILNTLVTVKTHLAETVQIANALLNKENEAQMFVTMIATIIDSQTGELTYVNAGHWKPLILKKNGEILKLEGESGPALGIIQDIVYKEFTTTLEDGDTFFLYSDGITEAVNQYYEEFGFERLKNILHKYHHLQAKKLVEKTILEVIKFCDEGELIDDLTCLAVSFSKS